MQRLHTSRRSRQSRIRSCGLSLMQTGSSRISNFTQIFFLLVTMGKDSKSPQASQIKKVWPQSSSNRQGGRIVYAAYDHPLKMFSVVDRERNLWKKRKEIQPTTAYQPEHKPCSNYYRFPFSYTANKTAVFFCTCTEFNICE